VANQASRTSELLNQRPRSEAAKDPLVVFTPSGLRGRFPPGTPLLTVARQLGVDLDSVCGGRGLCGRCEIRVVEGQFPKYAIRSRADHASPLSSPEERFADRGALPQGHRLSCHTKVEGDLVIDVPPGSQVHRQVVRKPYQERDIAVNPVVHLHTVEVETPRLEAPRGDLERLLDALAGEWQLADLACDPQLLPRLQADLRTGGRAVTVAVRTRCEIVGLWPGFKDRVFGVAVDVGSTTLAAHLCELASGAVLASAGVMNPQIRFGEDLMSRVSYAMMHDGGAAEMTLAVRGAIDALVARLVRDADATPDDVIEMTFVGNPIMHHLLLQPTWNSPSTPGRAPTYCPVSRATSAPTPRPCCSRRRRGSTTRPRCSWTWAPMRRSCSAHGAACWPPRALPARPSRARRSPADSVRRRAPWNACASIP
jgi:uncharacterized 2Fe-2S/4Fe-4S cluster protein (DUF4445 family)